MTFNFTKKDISQWIRRFDWTLLIFLLLFLNVKLVIKAVAILIIYVFRPDFKFGFTLKKGSRLPLFYVLVIAIAAINWVFGGNFSDMHYNLAMLTGIIFWIACILAIHQLKLSVERTPAQILHNTITLFLILNIFFSFLNLAFIIFETGAINPYLYQGMHQKYFIGTGDNIRGITFDSSATNAIINSFGVIYSLKRSKFFITLACMSVMLLTASNLTNILLVVTFAFIFIFKSDRNQKSVIIVCSLMLMIFLIKISPQNAMYIEGVFRDRLPELIPVTTSENKVSVLEKPDSLLNENEKKQKLALFYLDSLFKLRIANEKNEPNQTAAPTVKLDIKPSIPKDNIHTEPFQKNKDSTPQQKKLLEFAQTQIPFFDTSLRSVKNRKKGGKITALSQTIIFYKEHPAKIFTGTGIGKFSSKLAFRISCLGIAGGYPKKIAYINEEFKNNHLRLYLDYFTKEMELHSFTNTPNSVYDQLAAEYGLAGIISFLFFYLSFFIRYFRRLTYGAPLLILLLGALGTEYWFEQLSIIIVFELLLLLNIKETKELSGK